MFENIDWQGSGGVRYVVPGGSGTNGMSWADALPECVNENTGRRMSIDPNPNIAKMSATFPRLILAFALLLAICESTRVDAQELPPLSAGPRTVTREEQGALWYDPRDGRMWVSVNFVYNWYVRRVPSGPSDWVFKAIQPGVLPADSGFIVSNERTLGQTNFGHFSYSQPVDLGLLGPIGKPASDFNFFSSRGAQLAKNVPVFIVPEPRLGVAQVTFLLLGLRCIAHVRVSKGVRYRYGRLDDRGVGSYDQ